MTAWSRVHTNVFYRRMSVTATCCSRGGMCAASSCLLLMWCMWLSTCWGDSLPAGLSLWISPFFFFHVPLTSVFFSDYRKERKKKSRLAAADDLFRCMCEAWLKAVKIKVQRICCCFCANIPQHWHLLISISFRCNKVVWPVFLLVNFTQWQVCWSPRQTFSRGPLQLMLIIITL